MGTMNTLLHQSKLFLKRNAPTILTVVGSVGVVVTSVMAAKATPKALKLLEEVKQEKGEELTKLEVVTVAAPVYIPAVLVGASTIACIFGANILNKRHQAALMSAYALLDQSYKDYKKKVDELYGEGSNKEIEREIVKDKYNESDLSIDDSDGKELFYDAFSERYFRATMADVLEAEYEINHILARDCGVYLNEFYEQLGIDTVDYGDYIGWSSFELVETYWYCWVEFEHEKVTMDDGLECTIIHMLKEPTFDFENY
jgi:hypothetical protein